MLRQGKKSRNCVISGEGQLSLIQEAAMECEVYLRFWPISRPSRWALCTHAPVGH